MLVNKQEEFGYKITRAIDEVGVELMEQKSTLPSLRNFRLKPGGFNFPSDQLQRELMRPARMFHLNLPFLLMMVFLIMNIS
jgi:two-component system phosphate regulon sensor histidine kinase PhoR